MEPRPFPKLTNKESSEEKLPIIHKPAYNLAWAERTMCSCLEDMRKHITFLEKVVPKDVQSSLHILHSLVEEVQVYGNRMEAGLQDFKEYENVKKEYKELKEEVKKLKKEKKELDKK